MNPTRLVPLTGTGPRVIIWLYVSTMVVLALWSLDDVREVWPTVVGLVIFVAIGIAFTVDAAEPMSLWCALFVAAAWPGIAALISWQLIVAGGHAQWYFGAGTVSLFYLSLRGRMPIAWAGFAVLASVIVVWGATTTVGVPTALALVGKQLPIMIVGTLFALGMRRTLASIERLTLAASARASAEAVDLATTAERNERLADLDAVATPLLAKLVDGSALTDSDRLEFSIAEAELRDGLRARTLSVPSLVAAAREARRRGVDVVLLDDSDPTQLSTVDLAAVVTRVSEALDESHDGRIVARLLPPGRPDVATLLIDGSHRAGHEVVHASLNDEEPATS